MTQRPAPEVTKDLRMQVASAWNGRLAHLIAHPDAERREDRLLAVHRNISAALWGSDEEVLAAKDASGAWGPT